jgi:hypothetical protein
LRVLWDRRREDGGAPYVRPTSSAVARNVGARPLRPGRPWGSCSCLSLSRVPDADAAPVVVVLALGLIPTLAPKPGLPRGRGSRGSTTLAWIGRRPPWTLVSAVARREAPHLRAPCLGWGCAAHPTPLATKSQTGPANPVARASARATSPMRSAARPAGSTARVSTATRSVPPGPATMPASWLTSPTSPVLFARWMS